jgi:putative YphP/YqiW family bacilliredoxin
MYPKELTAPMAKELTDFGFEGLTTVEEVDRAFEDKSGTMLIMVNSICGCAAGNARPAVKFAIKEGKKPDRIYTVFAGVDIEATARAREYLLPYPPSSPCIALFKDGEIVNMVERRHIEGNSAQAIANHLMNVFEEQC